ncbi:hypothetical protein K503DRAFT_784809 [Rhizopogon vinicolor AM-OR11-026]|uniref:WW domain-containing protein n=1 Tax=Rhizopogon vinicolor AM-OR11-026 TaxID=1314800 RepID=A0A1B7MTC0_9AGAM|nr:hypothetical protein K503DRAFT_784809 [Rhizopogon vinicolor AM-OR11-026]
MMRAQFLAYVFEILKKWLSRLARRPASLLFSFLSLLRRFTAVHGRRWIAGTRFSIEALMQSPGDVEGDHVPIYPSLFPPDQTLMGDRPSHSDVPYSSTYSRPILRQGTEMHVLEADTTKPYSSAAQSNRFLSGSVSSLHSFRHAGESQSPPDSPRISHDQKGKGIDPLERGVKEGSLNNRTFLERPLQTSTSPGPSRLLGLHELAPRSQWRASPMNSSVSLNTRRSFAGSLAVSESGRSEYRKHTGPVHSLSGSVHGSRADLHHGSPNKVSFPLGLPFQAVPVSDSGIDTNVHFTVPPGSDGEPGSEVITLYQDELAVMELVPGEIKRYEGKIRPPNDSVTSVPAMTTTFPAHDVPVPPGWTSVVHPEGSRYFVNQEKRTFTEVNICDVEILWDVKYAIENLLYRLESIVNREELDMNWVDLVIEPKANGDDDNLTAVFWYYFVNHRSRCIFWLNEFHPKDIISNCKGVESLSHICLAIQAQYWKHWDYFPSLCPVTEKLVDDVKDMLMHAKCDRLSSKQSSAAYDVVELSDYLSVVDRIKVYLPEDRSIEQCHAAIVIGRIMHQFSDNAFLNFHGENCARLRSGQTVHGWVYEPSMLMVILAPILFLEPATVLLNANVGFLAITSVDKGGKSAIQMASYMSLVTSLGSIVLGLFFVSQDRTSGQSTAGEAASFLSNLRDGRRGLEKLAIIYSLPKALLMWGMVFFFAAFSIDWWTPGDTKSKAVVGPVTLLVFMMIAFSIIRIKQGDGWGQADLKLLSHLPNAWKQGVEVMGIERVQRGGLELFSHVTNACKRGVEFMAIGRARMNDDIILAPTNTAGGLSQEADVEADAPMRSSSSSVISSYPNSFIPTMPAASVHSPHQLNDGNAMLLSPHLHINPSFLSGVGSPQHIGEDTPIVSQDQPSAETRRQPNHASLNVHSTTSPYAYSASEVIAGTAVHVQSHSDGLPIIATTQSEPEGQTALVATELGAPIPPDPLHTDERETVNYTENVVSEEPKGLENPQFGLTQSTTPTPRILAKSATDDDFRHAPPAVKWTLRDGHDLEEYRGEQSF